MKPQFLVASISSGAGKTIFTAAVSRLLKRRGMYVQTYKCGPDFIDPQYLSIATDKSCINIDSWMSSPSHSQHVYNKYGERGDVCICDGTAGLFDGYERSKGSCGEIAASLHLPVVLVINARSIGFSIAALINGLKHFDSSVKIIGVVFNQITSIGQFNYLQDACRVCETECFGYIPYSEELRFPTKHAALTQNNRNEINAIIDRAADLVEKYIDVDKILSISLRSFPCMYTLPYSSDMEDYQGVIGKKFRIAVARDVAFNFIYKENIARLSQIGSITYFSPVYSDELPDADILYIPSGFPELFARQLHRRQKFLQSIKEFAEKGGKILAEGSAVALLCESLTVREGGTAYRMCGILPYKCDTVGLKLHSGYRSFQLADRDETMFKGNEYNYCNLQREDLVKTDIKQKNARGVEVKTPLFRYKNVIACFTSLYWGDKDIMALWG